MDIMINSERDFRRVSNELAQMCEHPLFGENTSDITNYDEIVSALESWREMNPELISDDSQNTEARLHKLGFWDDL